MTRPFFRGGVSSALAILVAQTLVVAGCAALLTDAMVRNQGTFSYALDDPYIHLALSEQLAHGHYGLHPDIPAAPSSSILWPWLLVPGAATPWHGLLPLLLNGVALLWILSLLRQLLARSGLTGDGGRDLFAAGLVLWLGGLLNLPFLVATGMEHTLQVALALAVLRGLLDCDSDRGLGIGPSLLLLFALVAGPLVRYESLAVTVAALVFLVLRRRWLLASSATILTLLPLGLFSWFLITLGLPPLPSSVLSKSGLATALEGTASWASTFDATVMENLWRLPDLSGARQVATLLGALWALALWQRRRERPALPLCLGLALLAHLLFGRFAPNERYEMHLLAAGGLLLIYGSRRFLSREIDRHSAAGVLLALILVTLPWQAKTLKLMLQTPEACHNIYQQQYQMHRFVTEYYRRPVAVNDLGWVSFRNPEFVLDLWGVGDETSRLARMGNDPSWPAQQVADHRIGAALVYDRWFRSSIPEDWRPVAYLRLIGPRITPGDTLVTFYATREDSYREVLRAVRRLRATLPPDTQMRLAR